MLLFSQLTDGIKEVAEFFLKAMLRSCFLLVPDVIIDPEPGKHYLSADKSG